MEGVKRTFLLLFAFFVLVSTRSPVNAASDFTTCSVVRITPSAYPQTSPPLMLYLEDGYTDHLDQSYIDAISNGSLPVLGPDSTVSIQFQTALSLENLLSSVDSNSLRAEITANGQVLTFSQAEIVRNGVFEVSFPVSGLVGEIGENTQVSLNLRATQSGVPTRVCPSENMSNLFMIGNQTARFQDPVCTWQFSPDLSEVSASTTTLTATLSPNGFDQSDQRPYQLIFNSVNSSGDRGVMRESDVCSGSSCQRSLTVSNPVSSAYNRGTFSLVRYSSWTGTDGPISQVICSQSFSVDPETGNLITPTPSISRVSNLSVCKQAGVDEGLCNECFNAQQGIWTAVGCIPYNLTEQTVRAFIVIGLGLSGGVVVLTVLAGAFLMSTSQGDPKRVEEAKSLISSAIFGLMFIVFSVAILRFIGVNILRLPEFG